MLYVEGKNVNLKSLNLIDYASVPKQIKLNEIEMN